MCMGLRSAIEQSNGARSRERSACAASVTCSRHTIWASSGSTDQPALVNRGIGFAPDSSCGGNRIRTAGPTSESAQPRHRPMSPIPSIRVALVIPLANLISISVASGTAGSNPVSSSSQSVSAVKPEAGSENPRTLAEVCVWLGT